MKLALAILVSVLPMRTQQVMNEGYNNQPIDKTVFSNLGGYHITGTIDTNGCFSGEWNALHKRCEFKFTRIAPNGETVNCTLMKQGSLGEQPIECFYVPKKQVKK